MYIIRPSPWHFDGRLLKLLTAAFKKFEGPTFDCIQFTDNVLAGESIEVDRSERLEISAC